MEFVILRDHIIFDQSRLKVQSRLKGPSAPILRSGKRGVKLGHLKLRYIL